MVVLGNIKWIIIPTKNKAGNIRVFPRRWTVQHPMEQPPRKRRNVKGQMENSRPWIIVKPFSNHPLSTPRGSNPFSIASRGLIQEVAPDSCGILPNGSVFVCDIVYAGRPTRCRGTFPPDLQMTILELCKSSFMIRLFHNLHSCQKFITSQRLKIVYGRGPATVFPGKP